MHGVRWAQVMKQCVRSELKKSFCFWKIVKSKMSSDQNTIIPDSFCMQRHNIYDSFFSIFDWNFEMSLFKSHLSNICLSDQVKFPHDRLVHLHFHLGTLEGLLCSLFIDQLFHSFSYRFIGNIAQTVSFWSWDDFEFAVFFLRDTERLLNFAKLGEIFIKLLCN